MSTRLLKADTVIEIVAQRDGPDGREVRIRYISPVSSDEIQEWYLLTTLLAAGWEVQGD